MPRGLLAVGGLGVSSLGLDGLGRLSGGRLGRLGSRSLGRLGGRLEELALPLGERLGGLFLTAGW